MDSPLPCRHGNSCCPAGCAHRRRAARAAADPDHPADEAAHAPVRAGGRKTSRHCRHASSGVRWVSVRYTGSKRSPEQSSHVSLSMRVGSAVGGSWDAPCGDQDRTVRTMLGYRVAPGGTVDRFEDAPPRAGQGPGSAMQTCRAWQRCGTVRRRGRLRAMRRLDVVQPSAGSHRTSAGLPVEHDQRGRSLQRRTGPIRLECRYERDLHQAIRGRRVGPSSSFRSFGHMPSLGHAQARAPPTSSAFAYSAESVSTVTSSRTGCSR